MMNVRGIQRNMKNVVKNYSDAQVKVREATSNDPWGPPSTLMAEIADLTYNVVAFSEIMQMIWKRLNDHGKNWRHVYKALVLLEYLIKTGSDKVAQQCKENIFAIQTLKDFQYLEENKDQGMNVREKSKMLVSLLKDEERLKIERSRALKAKERFAQSMSYAASDPQAMDLPKTSMSYHESLSGIHPEHKPLATDLESARPQTIGEEELQLQLALAMSKEEAEAEEKVRKNDDLRLQLALSESQKQRLEATKRSAVEDLLSLNTGMTSDPWGAPTNGNSSLGAVGGAVGGAIGGAVGGLSMAASLDDPWAAKPLSNPDPWNPQAARSSSATNDPWQPSPPPNPNPTPPVDPWSPMDARPSTGQDGSFMGNGSRLNSTRSPETIAALTRKTPESFLGPNSNLVNLDALVSTKTSTGGAGGNPFAGSVVGASSLANPFQAAKPAAPTINQLRSQGSFPVTSVNNQMNFDGLTPSVISTSSVSSNQASNPFSL